MMNQQLLFTLPPAHTSRSFGGDTFVAEFDAERLTGQWKRVWDVMQDGDWRTLSEIQRTILARFDKYDSEASISARVRDLRKPQFGGHTVERRRRGEASRGIHEYRVAR